MLLHIVYHDILCNHIAIEDENGISSHGSLKALHNACIVSCMLQESSSSSADFSLIKSSVETGRESVIAMDSCSIQHRTSLQWIIMHWQWHDVRGRAYKSDSCKACQPMISGVHNEQFLGTPAPMQMASPPQRCQVTKLTFKANIYRHSSECTELQSSHTMRCGWWPNDLQYNNLFCQLMNMSPFGDTNAIQ